MHDGIRGRPSDWARACVKDIQRVSELCERIHVCSSTQDAYQSDDDPLPALPQFMDPTPRIRRRLSQEAYQAVAFAYGHPIYAHNAVDTDKNSKLSHHQYLYLGLQILSEKFTCEHTGLTVLAHHKKD